MIILMINQENCSGSTIFWIIVTTHVHSNILSMTEFIKEVYAYLHNCIVCSNNILSLYQSYIVVGYLLDCVECGFMCLLSDIDKRAISKVMFSMLVTYACVQALYIHIAKFLRSFRCVSMMLNNKIESSLRRVIYIRVGRAIFK